MIKKTITYKNYADETETGEFFFHLSKGELTLMQLSAIDQNTEGFQDRLDKISKGLQGRELAAIFEEMIESSYGEKTIDGKRFDKDPSLFRIFKSTGAYSELITELISDAKSAAEFINGLMPADLKASVQRDVSDSKSARDRSESDMQGFQNKKVDTAVKVVPELPSADPVFEEVTPEVFPTGDLSSLSKEELIARLNGN